MHEVSGTPLAELTTLRLGGPGKQMWDVETEDELVAAVAECDTDVEELLVLGGGSNLVVADAGFNGTVLRVRTSGITVESRDTCSGASVRVAAGEDWDGFVARAVDEGWVGVEALSGIPGRVGAAPIQNVGAYGQEIADTLSRVRVYDRAERRIRTLPLAECEFGYRTSRFKRDPQRHVVLEVVFQLRIGELSAPVRYAELAGRLGVELGERAPLPAVREGVLALRRRKGMVLDPADHDTWSAGSFFTNPVVPAEVAAELPDGAPCWPVPEDSSRVKVGAAWLIEHAGFDKGYPGHGEIRLSGKHTLALTNRGAGTTMELLALAREIRTGVVERHGIRLEPEPTLIALTL